MNQYQKKKVELLVGTYGPKAMTDYKSGKYKLDDRGFFMTAPAYKGLVVQVKYCVKDGLGEAGSDIMACTLAATSVTVYDCVDRAKRLPENIQAAIKDRGVFLELVGTVKEENIN